MARLYVRKKKRKYSQFLMTSVITYIRKTGILLRKTSKKFSVRRTTIQRRIERNKVFLSKGARTRVEGSRGAGSLQKIEGGKIASRSLGNSLQNIQRTRCEDAQILDSK